MFRFISNVFSPPVAAPLTEGPLSKDQLTRIQVIDTYRPSSQLIGSLSVNHLKRREFLNQHQDATELLLQDPGNPFPEEGRMLRNRKRQREGEIYITPAAFEKLCSVKLKDYLPHKKFLIIKGKDALSESLKGLALAEGQDAVVAYFDDVHAMTIYFRQLDGRTHCFLVETIAEGEIDYYSFLKDIQACVEGSFAACRMVLSTTRLQRDYYSCTIFALKAIKYFFKHGEEVFPYLEKALRINASYDSADAFSCYHLPAAKLMPALLKMSSMMFANLPADQLNTIVSHKNNLTLGEYWSKYLLQTRDGVFNSAVLFKRYKYIAQLDDLLKDEKAEASESNGVKKCRLG